MQFKRKTNISQLYLIIWGSVIDRTRHSDARLCRIVQKFKCKENEVSGAPFPPKAWIQLYQNIAHRQQTIVCSTYHIITFIIVKMTSWSDRKTISNGFPAAPEALIATPSARLNTTTPTTTQGTMVRGYNWGLIVITKTLTVSIYYGGWVGASFYLGIVQLKIKHMRMLSMFIHTIDYHVCISQPTASGQYGLTWPMIIIRCNLP